MKAERIQTSLQKTVGWKTIKKKSAITKTFTSPNFRSAVAFVQYVGELAEAANHHPDIDIRYNKVTFVFSTHDPRLLDSVDRIVRLEDGRVAGEERRAQA